MADAVYRREGELYHPTEWAGSPWSSESQHGGPINALMARAVSVASRDSGLQAVRLGVDLLGPVPIAPLRLSWCYTHRSRRTAFVDAQLHHRDSLVAQARAHLLSAAEPDRRPRSRTQPECPLPTPDELEGAPLMPHSYRATAPPGFHFSLELRMVPNQTAAWLSTSLDLVEGEPLTEFERCAALADVSAGLLGRTELRQRLVDGEAPREPYVNTDTYLHFERMPVGTWLGIEKILLTDRDGIGNAAARLHDARGRFGIAQQSLLVRSA